MLSSDPAVIAKHPHTTYDLMANVVHDGEPGSGKGTYRVHVLHQVIVMSFVLCQNVCANFTSTQSCLLFCHRCNVAVKGILQVFRMRQSS